MLCIYTPDCTDFTTNGLGTIAPSSALVKEALNGEYELEVVHPLDDAGKWHRLIDNVTKIATKASRVKNASDLRNGHWRFLLQI